MRTNKKPVTKPKFTANGGKAAKTTALQDLRRLTLSCMLLEDSYYETGSETFRNICSAVQRVSPDQLAEVAIEARIHHNLRHVSLLMAALLCKYHNGDSLGSNTIEKVIQRADELGEFVAIWAKIQGVETSEVKKTMSAQVKKGLARAFGKFDEHQLAKYDRDTAVKLRDVMFLCHPKAANRERDRLYKRLIKGTMKTPDTWEVALSAGKDKGKTFKRLIREKKLGYMALLRNLRNMVEAGVDEDFIEKAIGNTPGREKILPFRFVAAARAVPSLEPALDAAMQESIGEMPYLDGKTIILVDVSDSMNAKLSEKSDLTRMDAAATLASIINCQRLKVYTFSTELHLVPTRRGMAGIDAIIKSQEHSGTYLRDALKTINKTEVYDRIIVITDEQSSDGIEKPQPRDKGQAYLINVANSKNGVGYGDWVHIDGFSENVIRFIHEYEEQ